jgi:hypothetical protein
MEPPWWIGELSSWRLVMVARRLTVINLGWMQRAEKGSRQIRPNDHFADSLLERAFTT